MIEQIVVALSVAALICIVLLLATVGLIAWDTRSEVLALGADMRRALSTLLAPAGRVNKAPVGYDARRDTPPPTKADAPPDSAC